LTNKTLKTTNEIYEIDKIIHRLKFSSPWEVSANISIRYYF